MWNLQAPDGELDVSYDTKNGAKENEAEWWNQQTLTNLDLSSNVLASLSPDIGNLQELTVLNVNIGNFDFLRYTI